MPVSECCLLEIIPFQLTEADKKRAHRENHGMPIGPKTSDYPTVGRFNYTQEVRR